MRGEKSHKNFESTIRNGVPLSRIKGYLSKEGLQKVSAEDIIYAWGNREGTKSQWESMENGDTVIFYAHKKLVLTGEVYHKQHDSKLALAMWPPDEKGNPWAYTFFLKNLKFINIPMHAFNIIAGYKPKFIVQGFTPITEKYLNNILKNFGTVEKLLYEFETDNSEEMPLSNESIYVNVDKNIEPEIVSSPSIKPRVIQQILSQKENKPFKTDHLERSRKNAITGSKGEELVFKQEVARLRSIGSNGLANQVKRISIDDDSKGYDILSFDEYGKERYIEVKTSVSKSNGIRFYLSQNEYNAARKLSNYYIYYVDGINSKNPRITQIKEPIKMNLFLVRTDTYVIEGTRN